MRRLNFKRTARGGALSYEPEEPPRSRLAMNLPPVSEAQAALQECGFVVVRDCVPEPHNSRLAAVATSLATRYGAHVIRRNDEDTLDYHVVTGDLIKSEAPLLFALYTAPQLLSWIRGVTQMKDLAISPHLRSSININCLTEAGQHYPWHTDAVPYTALLFLSTLSAAAGGEFLIRATNERGLMRIPPRRGDFVFMDGKRCAHAVAPLACNSIRLTVPMVYPIENAERPRGLDDYLYNSTAKT